MRHRLDGLYPELHLDEDLAAAIAKHSESRRILYRVRLMYLWVGLHAAIAIIGLGLTIAIAS